MGCGPCNHLKYISEKGYLKLGIGVDINEGFISICRRYRDYKIYPILGDIRNERILRTIKDVLGKNTVDILSLFGNTLAHFSINDLETILTRLDSFDLMPEIIIFSYVDWIGKIINEGYKKKIMYPSGRVSIHLQYNPRTGKILREEKYNGKDNILLEFYIWSPWILEFLMKNLSYKLRSRKFFNYHGREMILDVYSRIA